MSALIFLPLNLIVMKPFQIFWFAVLQLERNLSIMAHTPYPTMDERTRIALQLILKNTFLKKCIT